MKKAPAFQHRHYAPIAEIFARHVALAKTDEDRTRAIHIANDLETMFAMDNEHFERWRAAWRGSPSKKDARTAARLVQS